MLGRAGLAYVKIDPGRRDPLNHTNFEKRDGPLTLLGLRQSGCLERTVTVTLTRSECCWAVPAEDDAFRTATEKRIVSAEEKKK